MRSSRARQSRPQLGFERLEVRLALSAVHGSLEPASVRELDGAKKKVGNLYPTGLTPAATRSYYGFDQVSFGGVAADGAGQTIAIVTARHNPNIYSDLAAFDQTFGLAAPPSFRVVNQYGGTKLPKKNKGWASETALDVEWAHAIAPGANILLVEAKSDSLENFVQAIDYARHAPGVTVVSVSAAGDEFSQESIVDSLFTTPPGHEGVTFVFASGDDGGVAEYPSSSPNVLSVGGTTLQSNYPAQWTNESVWTYGGGGASKYEGVPSYQSGLGLTSRGTPDVAYNADPYTGFAVLDTYGNRGWAQYGGTSAGTPQWAALIAIANQGRELVGKTPLAGAQAALYAMPSNDFHDIVSGGNQQHYASAGYDLASGLGSPIADRLIPDLVAFSGSTSFTVGLAPAVSFGKKTKYHFSSGVDAAASVATGSLDAGTGSARSLVASSIDAAYEEKSTLASLDVKRMLAALTLVDSAPPIVDSIPAGRTSSKARLGSTRRDAKVSASSANGELASVDTFFAGLGESLAAA